MRPGFIVIREEKHLGTKHWVCEELDDALKIANDVVEYWKGQYEAGDFEIDETLYADLLFHYDRERGFRVAVQPVDIRVKGEHGPCKESM